MMSSADRLPLETSGGLAAPSPPTAGRRTLQIDGVVAIVYVLLIALWSILIQLHGGPDELNHLFLLEYLVHFGSIPEPHVDPLHPYIGDLTGVELNKNIDWYYGLPFAHVLGSAGFAKLFSPLFPGHEYLAARLFNWILGGVFVFSLIQALRLSGLQISAVRLIAILIVTIPQVSFIFAYFNHDAFGLAAVTLSLHGFLRMVRFPGPVSHAVYFGACCGLILLSKPYHYPALLFFAILLLVVQWNDPRFPLRTILLPSLLSCSLISVPFLAWTFYLFGDVTGQQMLRYVLEVHPGISSASLGVCYIFCKDTFINWNALGSWSWSSFTSFFGVLGWMNLPLPMKVYLFWFVPLVVLFGVLSAIFIANQIYRSSDWRRALFNTWFVTLTILMLLGAASMSLFNSQTIAPQAQGRYLFVVLPFIAYCLALFAIDAQAWLRARRDSKPGDSATTDLPAQAQVVAVLALLATGMLLLNIYTAIFVVAPANRAWAGPSAALNAYLFSDDLTIDFRSLADSLSVTRQGLAISVLERPDSVEGWVDVLSPGPQGAIELSGWAYDKKGREPAAAVVLVHKGAVVHVAKVGSYRSDVAEALGTSAASRSGFQARIWAEPGFDPCSARVLAITRSMQTGELRYAKNICRRRELTAPPATKAPN